MIIQKRMRHYSVYFTNGHGQVFVLEPQDVLVDSGKDIHLTLHPKDELITVDIRRESVSYTRLRSYTVEVDDSPIVREPKEREEVVFRG